MQAMTSEELALLLTGEVQQAIAAARGRDPLEAALDRGIPHARLVATQLKYLARAERKLPMYAAAQCILPPRAFEQASSEACAAHKGIGGDAVLDLTCGLGVDAYFLSRRFRRVVTLERDAVLAAVARENFRRLGAANIEVVHTSAEEYLARAGLRFDWVYADPDRRADDGRKQVVLEACSPDITALRPRIRAAAGRLCLKNSPLFDVDEALRLFPAARVEVVSLGDECKEVVVCDDGGGPSVTATALGLGSFTVRRGAGADPAGGRRNEWETAAETAAAIPDAATSATHDTTHAATLAETPSATSGITSEATHAATPSATSGAEPAATLDPIQYETPGAIPAATRAATSSATPTASTTAAVPPPAVFDPARYRWLVVPDVALRKARLTRLHLAGKADCWSDNGFGFAAEEPQGVIGRIFAVERIEPYDPRRLRRELKGCGAECLKRDFPLAVPELMRRLGLHAGGGVKLAFTKIGNDFWSIRLK